MGVRQDFYHPYAKYLAANGVHVLTFDYRGMGWSRPPGTCAASRRRERLGGAGPRRDAERGTRRRPESAAHLHVGHSLGGQLLGVLPGNARVRAALTVTAGSGYYKFNDAHAGRRCASSGSSRFPPSRRSSATSPARRCAWWATCPAAWRGSGESGACTPSTCWRRATGTAMRSSG